jgi:hypothetical protein
MQSSHHRLLGLWSLLLTLAWGGCATAEMEQPALPAVMAPALPEPVTPPPAEARQDLPPSQVTATVGAAASTVVSGGLTMTVPPGAVEGSVVFKVSVSPTLTAKQTEALPLGKTLGRFRITPWDPGLQKTVRLELPLATPVEPGAAVELLGWHPSMDSYLVVGIGEATRDGKRANFWVRQLGDLVVRAQPVAVEREISSCKGGNLAPRGSVPQRTEADVVGGVALDERLERDRAFAALSDLRRSSALHRLEFKNEEMRPPAPKAAVDRRDHQDEDYLMDPAAAAALVRLADLVAREWQDPLTGGPAFRVRVTEGFDSMHEHSARSTHYQGRANDLTLSPVPAATGDARRAYYGRLSRLAVCAGYDYVLFEDQAHVHASVRATELAVVAKNVAGATQLVKVRLFDGRVTIGKPVRWTTDEASARLRWLPGDQTIMESVLRGGELRVEALDKGAATVSAHTVDPSLLAIDPSISADGSKRLVVRAGAVWLENTDGAPSLGSQNASGAKLQPAYPLHLFGSPGLTPISVAFRQGLAAPDAAVALNRP